MDVVSNEEMHVKYGVLVMEKPQPILYAYLVAREVLVSTDERQYTVRVKPLYEDTTIRELIEWSGSCDLFCVRFSKDEIKIKDIR